MRQLLSLNPGSRPGFLAGLSLSLFLGSQGHAGTAPVKIFNPSDHPIFVVLDTRREGDATITADGGANFRGFLIQPGNNRGFNEASIFDSPTFHLWTLDTNGRPEREFLNHNTG